jgi:AcrR family transcriptional regulator
VAEGAKEQRRGEESKTAILDAAEKIFATAGFDSVSLREIAFKARVPLGLTTYHFGSKEGLFEAVIARRADELNGRRREALLAIRGEPTLSQVLDAFFRPYLELMMTGGPGWQSYGQLVAQTGQQERWSRLITGHFKETRDLILGALADVEPRLSNEALSRGYVHMISVMFGIFAGTDLLKIISKGAHTGRNLERSYEYALRFMVGAFEALAAESGRRETRGKVARRRVSRVNKD